VSDTEGRRKLKIGCSTGEVSIIFTGCYKTRSSINYKHYTKKIYYTYKVHKQAMKHNPEWFIRIKV
jgi:hypothetical protein